MSKTYKDKANHFVHKLLPKSPMYMLKSKLKYTPEDIPADVKDLANLLETSYKGLRHGNNRKYEADLKLEARKKVRLLDKREVKKEIDNL
jgi:hypothetical protein